VKLTYTGYITDARTKTNRFDFLPKKEETEYSSIKSTKIFAKKHPIATNTNLRFMADMIPEKRIKKFGYKEIIVFPNL